MEELSREAPMPFCRRGSARDPRLARLLGECYRAELCSVAAYTYRAAVTEPHSKELSDAFDRIATDEMEHFRLLGALIVSLGGEPMLRMRWQSGEGVPSSGDTRERAIAEGRMLSEAIEEERCEIDRYQTLMGQTEDRIVRSFLCQILSDEERHVARLKTLI
ncbi:MAG: ferritin-like domain-containing protein [Clostridia bacterium]|nr:ferritin-like domain-containing protein [Clostridia bacterium]